MQETASRVKFLMREENSIFDRYYYAREFMTHPSHVHNLDLIQRIMIDGDGDLTPAIWEHFLENLASLGIDPPEFNRNDRDPGRGRCYFIPVKANNKHGHFAKLARRRRMRDELRDVWKDAYTHLGLQGPPVLSVV